MLGRNGGIYQITSSQEWELLKFQIWDLDDFKMWYFISDLGFGVGFKCYIQGLLSCFFLLHISKLKLEDRVGQGCSYQSQHHNNNCSLYFTTSRTVTHPFLLPRMQPWWCYMKTKSCFETTYTKPQVATLLPFMSLWKLWCGESFRLQLVCLKGNHCNSISVTIGIKHMYKVTTATAVICSGLPIKYQFKAVLFFTEIYLTHLLRAMALTPT